MCWGKGRRLVTAPVLRKPNICKHVESLNERRHFPRGSVVKTASMGSMPGGGTKILNATLCSWQGWCVGWGEWQQTMHHFTGGCKCALVERREWWSVAMVRRLDCGVRQTSAWVRPGHLSSLGKEVLSKLFGSVPKPQSLHLWND